MIRSGENEGGGGAGPAGRGSPPAPEGATPVWWSTPRAPHSPRRPPQLCGVIFRCGGGGEKGPHPRKSPPTAAEAHAPAPGGAGTAV